MKQILQNARSGELELADVPAPMPTRGQVLVQNHYSVMSPGTDKMAMEFARKSMLAKARSRPDLVRQVMRKLQQEGPVSTYRTVSTRLEAPQPMGYSCAGIVRDVGPEVRGFSVGDRVACAGAGYANHAELVAVPENLVCHVPDSIGLDDAAFATLGAISLQGLRVADPTLGEIAAVVGLGLIGQLAVQLLRANGCRVLGIDLDPRRVRQSLDQGAEWADMPENLGEAWKDAATGGHGVDFCLVTAASSNAAPLQLAAELSRKKGRIAFVGAMPIELDRRVMFDKELSLRMSTSYGPGRYDRSYEELGLDYPLSYVRWTENRNLQAFLALLESGTLQPKHLDTGLCHISEAVSAYETLVSGHSPSLAVVFEYDHEVHVERTMSLDASRPKTRAESVAVSFIGAGNYAKGVLLPLMNRMTGVENITLVTATGASAKKTAEKFGFRGCGTETQAVFKDPNVEFVFIATRHDNHALLTIEALQEGKGVWLEKPVALNVDELQEVRSALEETKGFLSIGYNRRFSPHTDAIREFFASRKGPMCIHYRVAPGPTPQDTWLMDPIEGGGRIIGENCHFIDVCNSLVGGPVVSVFARALGDGESDDSMTATFSYADGSVVTLDYLANASADLPKEYFEVSADGRTARCTNYRTTMLSGRRTFKTFNQDKGQAAALDAVLGAFQQGEPSPFTPEEILNVSRVTFAMVESSASQALVEIERS
jgi:predicted dehydrogenase/threonine dehydrogenase-like Zn-dependent dehydrogenase